MENQKNDKYCDLLKHLIVDLSRNFQISPQNTIIIKKYLLFIVEFIYIIYSSFLL